jgi:hypothetical protein
MSEKPQEQQQLEVAEDPAIDTIPSNDPPPQPSEPAQQPEKKEPPRVHMSPNDAARMEIANRFRAQRNDPDDVDYHGNHAEDPTQTYGALAKDEPQVDPDPAPDPAPAPEPRKLKLKVRHEEIELPEEEVIALAQKAKAADTYLEDAKKVFEDARRSAPSRPHQDENGPDSVAEREEDPPADGRRTPHQASDDDAEFEELVEKIQYGDKAEAAEALRNTMRKQTAEEAQRLAWETRINDDVQADIRTYQAFAKENADIARDENATAVVRRNFLDGYRQDLLKIGVPEDRIPTDPEVLARHHRIYKLKGQPVRSVEKLLTDAKQTYLDWKGGPRPSPQQQQQQRQQPNQQPNGKPTVQVDRGARREAIPQQPSRAAVPPNMQQRQQTTGSPDRSSVVARMRAARGQV